MGPLEFVEREAFNVAFLIALGASMFVAVVAFAFQQSRGTTQVLPVAGLVGTGAAVVALRTSSLIPGDATDLYIGLGSLAVGGVISGLSRVPWPLGVLMLVPGAIFVAEACHSVAPGVGGWMRPFAIVATTLGGAALVVFDRRWSRAGLGPVLLAVTAAGIYVCVPDTEQALALFGGLLAVALLGWPKPLGSVGAAGACATVGLLVWVAAAGGRGRPGSVIGAIACLGVLALEPPIRAALRSRSSAATSPWSRDSLTLFAVHLLLVIVCARIAGSRSSAATAALIAGAALIGAATALLVAWRPRDPSHRTVPSAD